MMMDSNCLEVTAGKASVTIPRPAPCPTSSELDRLASQSSLPSPSPSPPTNAKSPPGTRPAPGLAFSSSSAPITNLWTFPKTSTFSSTASKFKPFAKYRTRRLSDDSLTDLSPPTHSDLDRVSPHWHPALDQTEHIEPSSPARSHRSSSIFLGNFKSNSLSQKPLKDNCNSAVNMNLFKSQGSHPSFSSRLRLLSSKHSSEKSKPQPEHSASRTLKPAVLKSFQSKATLSEAEQNNFTDPEEFEAIQSPPCDLRIVANPNYPPRSCSIGDPFGISDSFPELSRSSSSPNLNFPTTFSQRLSGESVRNINPASVSESPKRSHAPPPIKVPKLRASSIAIAVGSDSSPLGASSKPISRHQHSRSETGNHLVRRIAALEWPSYGKKPPTQESLIDISKPPVQEPPVDLTNHNPSQAHWNIDTFDVLPTLNSPRSAVISISNSSKVTKDKAPAMMPLQPAPRRLSGLAHHSNTDSKGPTMPLLISKHSRAIGNGAFAAAQPRPHSIMCSESDTTDFTATQSSAGSIKGSRLSNRVSFISVQPQYPETPKQSSAGFPQNSPWSPIQEVTEKQEPVRAPLSPGSIPFPTSEWPGRSASCDDQTDEPRNQKQAKQEIAFKTKQANRSSGKKESHRAISFDIRNFPLHLDTSQRSESLPHIAIPQPIKIPQFVSGSLPDLPALQDGRNAGAIFGKSALPLSIATVRPYESSDLSSLMSVASNGSSSEPWRSTNHICTPSSTPPSNRSSGFASKMASLKTSIPATHTACDSSSRVLSVDDFYLNINTNALLDLSRRDDKKVSRPRSMSDRGPDRLDIPTESFGPARFNSAHSISSSHSWQSPFENISSETACPLAASLEQASPRTAFLSPYGLAHSQVAPLERAESSSVSPSTRSPRKTHKSSFSNASTNSLTTSAGNFQRSDSLGSRKKAQITGFIPRTVLPSGGSVKPKASMGGVHLKSSRSSSLNSSDLKIEILDSNIHGPQDSKPRSTSNTFLPHLKNGINASSESSTTDGSNEFQSTNAIGRAPSSSSLSRFPRQAAPAPKLPLPYETYSRRHAQWSPVSPSPGNLSSITLSQLGSLDIANLLSNIEYSSQ
ncbi:hypothetical protein PSTG_01644 [Puccinia striiformis f. sp. tritici PST-78]|uniref:Uncharacterized protein n=1 Tax=Puccinia striiformis f. sp. tritici PST-78 TaxID=1165861 RepID=A0A0L0W2E2_9BASI|nr:hypothetical protein PSTG_01644 [Puccinia striiformis f. sp. tritici PST-78]